MATATKRARLLQQSISHKMELTAFIKKYQIEFKQHSSYMIRLQGVVDIYPTNKKYYAHEADTWGTYESLEELINYLNIKV